MKIERPAALWPVTTRRIPLGMDVSDEPRHSIFRRSENRVAGENASMQ
jgi:hypothetical protein